MSSIICYNSLLSNRWTKVNARLHDSCEASPGSLTKYQRLYKNNPTIPTATPLHSSTALLDCANAITLREITINNYTIIVTTTRGVNCKSYNESTPQNTLKQLIYAVHTHYN
jgi:hypothetical protein